MARARAPRAAHGLWLRAALRRAERGTGHGDRRAADVDACSEVVVSNILAELGVATRGGRRAGAPEGTGDERGPVLA